METDTNYSANLTPVFIPSVLHEVLSYLSHSKLKILRNVSLQWADEGWKLLRKKAVLKIKKVENLKKIHKHFFPMKNNFCTSLRFQKFSWTDVDLPIFLEFASEYGHMIKYIHLNNILSRYNSDESNLKTKLFTMFPNLEELVFSFQEPDVSSLNSSNISLQSDKDSHSCQLKLDEVKTLRVERVFRKEDGIFVMKLLKCAPNLRTISLFKNPMDALQTMSRLFRFIPPRDILGDDNENLLNDPFQDNMLVRHRNRNNGTYNELLSYYFLNEKHLYLNNIWHLNFHILITSDSQLQALKSRQCFSLKTLHLVLFSYLSTFEIQSLLSSFSETLESLYISLNALDENGNFSQTSRYHQIWDMSVKWKKLNLLCLRNIQSFSISLTEIMPHLKTLLLQGCSFPTAMKEVSNGEAKMGSYENQHNMLQTLVVNADESKRLTVQVLMSVGNAFPNLKKLKLENLSDSGLRVIFSNLQLLEDIFLESENFSDSGITGIKPEICKKLLKTKEIHPNKSFSCISDLKRLRKLEIMSSRITDISILYAISECKSLRKLFLCSPKISSKSVRKIIMDMNLAILEIEFCQQLPDTVVPYAKKSSSCSFEIHINKQGPKSVAKMTEYFINRAKNFHLTD